MCGITEVAVSKCKIRTKEQVLGKKTTDIADFFREDGSLIPVDEYPVNQVIQKKEPLRNFICGYKVHGKDNLMWALFNAVPIFDHEGNLYQVIATHLDISERKKMEEALQRAEARYRAIVEDQTELISRYLPDRRLTFVNNAFCRYFEKDPDELIGEIFMPQMPEDREKVDRLLDSLQHHRLHCLELLHPHRT